MLPVTAAGNRHAYYLYVVRHPKRDEIIARLKKRGIHLNVSYRWPIHIMEAYRWLGYRNGDLPVTEMLANEVFSLPMYPSLASNTQEIVCHNLREIIQQL